MKYNSCCYNFSLILMVLAIISLCNNSGVMINRYASENQYKRQRFGYIGTQLQFWPKIPYEAWKKVNMAV